MTRRDDLTTPGGIADGMHGFPDPADLKIILSPPIFMSCDWRACRCRIEPVKPAGPRSGRGRAAQRASAPIIAGMVPSTGRCGNPRRTARTGPPAPAAARSSSPARRSTSTTRTTAAAGSAGVTDPATSRRARLTETGCAPMRTGQRPASLRADRGASWQRGNGPASASRCSGSRSRSTFRRDRMRTPADAGRHSPRWAPGRPGAGDVGFPAPPRIWELYMFRASRGGVASFRRSTR